MSLSTNLFLPNQEQRTNMKMIKQHIYTWYLPATASFSESNWCFRRNSEIFWNILSFRRHVHHSWILPTQQSLAFKSEESFSWKPSWFYYLSAKIYLILWKLDASVKVLSVNLGSSKNLKDQNPYSRVNWHPSMMLGLVERQKIIELQLLCKIYLYLLYHSFQSRLQWFYLCESVYVV